MSASGKTTSSSARPRLRYIHWILLGLIILVFGLAIVLVTSGIREDIRAQIISRDADVLHATVMLQFQQLAEKLDDEVREPATLALVLLESARIRGVVAARLFETNGLFHTSFPIHVTESELPEPDQRAVLASLPVSRFHPDARYEDVFLGLPVEGDDAITLPLLEVSVPLQAAPDTEVMGIAQFMLEGDSIAREFSLLDRNLAGRGIAIFFAGAVLIGAAMGWALGRLQRANRQLATRTEDLLRANEELALAARTSAIGSVAAHLIHGLKNPLSGLHQFVNGRKGQTTDAGDDDRSMWAAAATSTRRMQQMVGEVVRVLREEQQAAAYSVNLIELEEQIQKRIAPLAKEHGVSFQVSRNAAVEIDNRQANLIILILGNLIHNALQASPAGGLVTLGMREQRGAVEFRVVDQGPGIPEAVRRMLFSPCASSKDGGSGIGLVISRQLANHLGAQVALESTSERGSVFVLTLPLAQRSHNSPLDEKAAAS
ncbi:MAG TPA: hypothetical protein DCY13_15175 [Verrucomicrobiales bacterium]|nr:hypothetical protein [Verrucomicrobiales bacterium]